MLTYTRGMTSDTRRHDYSNEDTRYYRDRDYAVETDYVEPVRDNVPAGYDDYMLAELHRTEKRRILTPEEYMKGIRPSSEPREERRERTAALERRLEGRTSNASRVSNYGRLDKKGVVAIVAYFLIVAVIATLIIINGAGTSSFVTATGSQAEVTAGAGNEVNSTTSLPVISQDSLGVMILSDGSVVDINLLESNNAYAYQPRTNWFDKLCDALSFIAGG